MTVSLLQWHAIICVFNCRMSAVSTNCECKLSRDFITMLETLLLCYYYVYVLSNVIIYVYTFTVSWRYSKKSRSKKTKKLSLSVCYWNINSLPAHKFSKLTQLKAHISMYKYDFICLSETTWIHHYLIVCSK